MWVVACVTHHSYPPWGMVYFYSIGITISQHFFSENCCDLWTFCRFLLVYFSLLYVPRQHPPITSPNTHPTTRQYSSILPHTPPYPRAREEPRFIPWDGGAAFLPPPTQPPKPGAARAQGFGPALPSPVSVRLPALMRWVRLAKLCFSRLELFCCRLNVVLLGWIMFFSTWVSRH